MRQVLIMRGLQGSGKSTLSAKIYNEFNGTKIICSADDYFIINGRYEWNAELLHRAHRWCNNLIVSAMLKNVELIIVDNTNIVYSGFKHYLQFADLYKYNVSIVSIDPTELSTIDLCKRNVHNARPQLIDKLKKKWHSDRDLNIFIKRAFPSLGVKLITLTQKDLNDPSIILQSLYT